MDIFENTTLVIAISTVGALITGLVLFLTKMEKLWEYCKRYDAMKRKRFALRQQPHCQIVCPAPLAMVEVSEKLEKISTQLAHNTQMTVDLSSDRLIQKAEYFLKLGYMPQIEKTVMFKMFLNYHFAGGNGPAMYIIDKTLKLPDIEGGAACDVDLSGIIETERNKRLNKKEEESK